MAAIVANFFMWLSCLHGLNLEPSYFTQLCIYTGATYREEIMHLSIIFLKLWIFLKIHILHFLSHLTYMPKILILHLAYHTHTYTDTHRHIQIPFSHFALFDSFGIHAKYIWHTTDLHMQILRYMYRDIDTQIQIHWDTCKFVNTYMFVYIYKHTHWCVCGESKEIVTSNALAR